MNPILPKHTSVADEINLEYRRIAACGGGILNTAQILADAFPVNPNCSKCNDLGSVKLYFEGGWSPKPCPVCRPEGGRSITCTTIGGGGPQSESTHESQQPKESVAKARGEA